MGLRARILRVTSGTGPRSKNVLRGLARGEKQKAQFDTIFQGMLDMGEVVMFRKRRHALYGPRKQRGAASVGFVAAVVAAIAGWTVIGVGIAGVIGCLMLIWFGAQMLP